MVEKREGMDPGLIRYIFHDKIDFRKLIFCECGKIFDNESLCSDLRFEKSSEKSKMISQNYSRSFACQLFETEYFSYIFTF